MNSNAAAECPDGGQVHRLRSKLLVSVIHVHEQMILLTPPLLAALGDPHSDRRHVAARLDLDVGSRCDEMMAAYDALAERLGHSIIFDEFLARPVDNAAGAIDLYTDPFDRGRWDVALGSFHFAVGETSGILNAMTYHGLFATETWTALWASVLSSLRAYDDVRRTIVDGVGRHHAVA